MISTISLPMSITAKPRLHRDWIDPHAYGIVKALQKQQHTTFLVGGCVRDLLLGFSPKDFDIATTAQPDEVRRFIHRAYVIGRRFRLVLVRRGEHQYEVATFRRELRVDEELDEHLSAENMFGTPEEDARRRDFTINSLFYDPIDDVLVDFEGGLADLEAGWIRMIGPPDLRLIEDPIRILRALRLAHKIQFQLDPELRAAIKIHGSHLKQSALPRRREELLKWLRLENPVGIFLEALDLGILEHILPSLCPVFENEEKANYFLTLVHQSVESMYLQDEPILLFGAFMWAFARAELGWEADKVVGPDDLTDHPVAARLMKDELGLFRTEQTIVSRAMSLMSVFSRRSEFERKAARRKMAVFNDEAGSLALVLARWDCLMSGSDDLFWSQAEREAAALRPREDSSGYKRSRLRSRPRRPAKSVQEASQSIGGPSTVQVRPGDQY